MSVAAAAAMLSLVACGASAPSGSGAQSRTATSAAEAPAPKPAAPKPKPKPIVVLGEGVLVIPYAATSLREFAADPYVVGVVRGTVTEVEAQADDVGAVNSIVTVAVERGLGLRAGSTIQASEPGGVVPMRAVRDQFGSKDWQQPLTARDRSRMVDFRMEGFPHSTVGDDVVMFLAAGAGDGGYSLATKLVANGSGFRFQDDEPPNPRWDLELSAATVDALIEGSTT